MQGAGEGFRPHIPPENTTFEAKQDIERISEKTHSKSDMAASHVGNCH